MAETIPHVAMAAAEKWGDAPALIENGEKEGGRTAGLDVLVERAFESSRGKTGKSRE